VTAVASSRAQDRFAGVHVLADDDARWPHDPVAQARHACLGGAAVIQLRAKHATDRVTLDWAHAIRAITREHGAMFVVNDRFDLALLADADAVHLGQDDFPLAALPPEARKRLAVGRSTHSVEQAREAARDGADYIAFGPVFETTSKETGYTERGCEALREIANVVAPHSLVAIGGIDTSNAAAVRAAGASGIAVISAIAAAPDPPAATHSLVLAFLGAQGRGNL
jgi:thiamine-phosphate pyrophosphorylase